MSRLELELVSRRATRLLAARIAAELAIGDVVYLEGPLGAGKTFFTRGLLRALGVPSAVPVTSPTFALIHEHEGRAPIAHLDLYRLDSAAELTELGLAELLERSIAVIEWGRRFAADLGVGTLAIELAPGAAVSSRHAIVTALDVKGARIVERLRER